MNTFFKCLTLGVIMAFAGLETSVAQNAPEPLPVVYADVPDVAMIRVGDTYYMSSTTMHMNPGLPIMKSKDLVNWQLVGYAYQTLGENDDLDAALAKLKELRLDELGLDDFEKELLADARGFLPQI